MDEIQVQAFGKLTLNCGDRLVAAYPTRHVEELLGYLLLHQQEVLQRESLIELLWPHEASKNGRGRLSTTLWRLRSLIDELGVRPERCLKTTRDTITFSPKPSPEVDVALFEERLTRAERASDPAKREQLFLEAHSLYRGPLCEGIYSDWCLIERERLARLHLRTLGQLMTCYLDRSAYQEAINIGELILLEDPLREEVYRALILSYGHLGRRSEAARLFQRCANSLMAELHMLPLPETIAAYRQVVTGRILSGDGDNARWAEMQQAFNEFVAAGDRLLTLLETDEVPVEIAC